MTPALALERDPAFARLTQALIQRTGLYYFEANRHLLWERVRRRMQRTGASDCGQYLAQLDTPGSGEAEWGELIAEVAIGETFFFRYAEQFAALRQVILPECLDRRRSERRLRIWSAGCAVGAEPYSVAIVLSELLGDQLPEWQIALLGTDINDRALAVARRARFSSWALRSMPAALVARYFEQQGADWQLRPHFQAMARFERHNLMTLLQGRAPLQLTGFDLILCRNVLIYFQADTAMAMLAQLRERLVEGGWLLVGHSEPNPAMSQLFEVVNLPGTVAYRRTAPASRAAPPAPRPPSLPPPPPSRPAPVQAPRRGHTAPPPAIHDPPAAARLTALADAGDYDAARAACRRAIEAAPLDPKLHFKAALLALAGGDAATAEAALRRALYLDKGFAIAHYQLGLLLLQGDRRVAGLKSLANAVGIAAALAPGEPLMEGDGMTAARLTENARLLIGRLTSG